MAGDQGCEGGGVALANLAIFSVPFLSKEEYNLYVCRCAELTTGGTMMSLANLGRIAAIVCVLPVLLVGPAAGKDDDSWEVEGKLIGKISKKTGKVKKSEDVSGIACTKQKGFPRTCLIIDDNLQDAQFVEVKDGKLVVGDSVNLIKNKFGDERLELDGEGVAFSQGFFYVIGSHGHPRDSDEKLDPVKNRDEINARIAANSQIVRIRVRDGADAKPEPTSTLRKIITGETTLKGFADRRLEENGVTIEGIAIKDDKTLFAGFRGPVLKGDEGKSRAVVLSVPLDALFDGGDAQHRVFRLPLGPARGVRDLVTYEDGILILAGPGACQCGTYAIYSWDGASENVTLLSELEQFDPARKPEGLLPLDRNGKKLRVLILFDGDEEGKPTPVEIPAPD